MDALIMASIVLSGMHPPRRSSSFTVIKRRGRLSGFSSFSII